MLKIVPSNQFKKDLKLAKRRGCNIELLREIVNTLAQGKSLDKKYRDHGLTGNYRGFGECHVEPDWLLIYHISQDALELFFLHRYTFGFIYIIKFGSGENDVQTIKF